MYRGRANAVVYFFLCLSILIIGILVYKQIQFSYVLKETVAGSDRSYFSVKALKEILAMNQVSLRTFFFTFVCFLIVLVSLLIVLQSTEKAYKLTNESNVRYTIKMTYPGIVLAVIGCFFLALSIYRSSDLQINASNRLVDQKKYQIVLDSLFEEKMMLEQGITALKQQPGKPLASAHKGASAKNVKQSAPQAGEVSAPAPVPAPVAATGPSEPKTTMNKGSKTQPDISSVVGQLPAVPLANKESKKEKSLKKQEVAKQIKPANVANDKTKPEDKKASEPKVASSKDTKPAAELAKAQEEKPVKEDENTAVSPQELKYAKQLQREATIYGHYPSNSELNAYNSIYKRLQKRRSEGDASAAGKQVFNSELHWAFALLQKTKIGYQPTPEELVRYEQTVQRNLDISETFEGRLR
jgi:hypothetical protein